MTTDNRRPGPAIPAALRELMASIGPVWRTDVPDHVRQMAEAFSAVLADAPKDGVARSNDLAYGSHPRQCLDLFQPDGKAGDGRGKPILIFLHGGAFVDGERNRTTEFYANILYFFARHGVLGINLEYRQAPEFAYPSGAEDVAQAVAWVRQNAARHGGDAQRVFLMAHSAGAAHAAGYAYDRRLQPASGPGIAGLIVISGRVRADNLAENPNARKVEAYYGSDASLFEERSPVAHVSADSLPTFIAFAEYENPLIDLYCTELAYRLATAKRRVPPLLRLRGHNHTSIVAHFNTAEEFLGREILDFIATTPAIA